jgi:glycerol uptake facilitator-like aquaporin
MSFKNLLTEFVITFSVVFVIAAVVSFLYSLIAHGEGVVDWDHSVRLAIIFGIVLLWIRARQSKQKP